MSATILKRRSMFLKSLKSPALLIIATIVLATGCARHYVIVTNNGAKITTNSRPKKKDGYYIYKDMQGKKTSIFAGRVAEIAPVTNEKKKTSSFEFIPAGQ